ncbi:hypothetical protein [Myroides marinus]|uniref:hypothetical protein n=1 Tax=Myroides marinus TaxID=703342 RepID=UPI002574DAB5|nr:hypothetical protein [Myroides marinus]MDM1369237.1 hypothetical protein [Myroides marinus]MDM1383673.1 hypothetical protein [Myroides marinus]
MKVKYWLLTILGIISVEACLAQTYDKVYIERKNVDTNNSIYKVGRNFYYTYNIKNAQGDELFISDKDKNTLTSNENETIKSLMKWEIIEPVKGKRTNRRQTEVRFSFIPEIGSRSYTGIVENEQNVWLHPFRMNFFKSLETAPFPYIHIDKSIGYTWSDQMKIGEYWSNKLWGEWQGELLLDYTYTITDEVELTTALGVLHCQKVVSTAKSKLGETTLVSYFSKEYGFVRMEYKLLTGLEVVLDLTKVEEVEIE